MKHHVARLGKKQLISICIAVVLLLSVSAYALVTRDALLEVRAELASSTAAFAQKVSEMEARIADISEKNITLESFLSDEQKRAADLEADKKRNERTIDSLEKLTTYDPELLKKYSKVYFLSENYSPPDLEDIDPQFRIKPDKDLKFLKEAYPFLEDLLEDANEQGIDLRVISSYRSFDEQMRLKSSYAVTYGAGTANQFSADQGYSEHQLGTTVDFGTPEVPGAYLSFENTAAFAWLNDNAHKYGFVLSYPKGNSYYTYEPWHWRFVGRDLADDVRDDGIYFYEMDQRDIDEYLIKTFE